MQRRALLAGVGAGFAALSGCLDLGRSPGADGSTPTDSPTASYPEVAVAELAVTPEYVALNSPDSITTYGDRAEQFVFARVATGVDPAPRRKEFRLETDGSSYAPEAELMSYGTLTNYRPLYSPGEGGWLAFALPKPVDGAGATVTWPGNEYALDDAAVARLEREPTTFAVREFAAPSSVEAGQPATVSLAVENTGETAGAFVGAVNRVGPWIAHTPVEALALEVDAGATATWEYTHRTTQRTDADRDTVDMTFHLDWRDGSRSVTTEVRFG